MDNPYKTPESNLNKESRRTFSTPLVAYLSVLVVILIYGGYTYFFFTSMDKSVFYLFFPMLAIIYVGICHFAGLKTKKFALSFLAINTESDIVRFKEFVIRQMKMSIVAILFGGAILLFYFFFLFSGIFVFIEKTVIFGFFLLLIIWSRRIRKYEKIVSNVPASTDILTLERDNIVKIWHTKLLPKFD